MVTGSPVTAHPAGTWLIAEGDHDHRPTLAIGLSAKRRIDQGNLRERAG
jgi:hypothetical protein